MEQPKEKTENIVKKRRRKQSPSSSKSSSSSSSIPLDLTLEILSKLPAESVLRFRCISKLWSSITTDPYFISSFKTRPRLLMLFRKGAKLFAFSLSQHNQNPNKNEGFSYSSSQPIHSYHSEECCFSDKTESVHGLICLQISTYPIIWTLA
ncbi:putative F-box protein [Raphanus sativus]|nr:putative F-box protein [Raphanus sativus]